MVMRVEFNQGIPEGCTQWLRENVGIGNIEEDAAGKKQVWLNDIPEYTWFYERIEKSATVYDAPIYYVPTITVKDEKLAMLFMLRWT